GSIAKWVSLPRMTLPKKRGALPLPGVTVSGRKSGRLAIWAGPTRIERTGVRGPLGEVALPVFVGDDFLDDGKACLRLQFLQDFRILVAPTGLFQRFFRTLAGFVDGIQVNLVDFDGRFRQHHYMVADDLYKTFVNGDGLGL